MASRDDILERLQQHQLADVPHPGDFSQGVIYDDLVSQFMATLEEVGGRGEIVSSRAAATAVLDAIPEYASAAKTCSLVSGVGRSTFELSAITDPHDLEDVDFAVLPGDLAVAENAAVWVTAEEVCHQTLHFLVQHLALVVPRDRVVSNLHQAYAQVDVGRTSFATWISGPSKTADIEQSLVKGAHGARTLTVLLIEE